MAQRPSHAHPQLLRHQQLAGTPLGGQKVGAGAAAGQPIAGGTPVPAVVPLPGRAMAPMPGMVLAALEDTDSDGVPDTPGMDQAPFLGYPFYIPGVAGHRLKHELGLPLVATFHTLARVKADTGDPEPRTRVDAETEVTSPGIPAGKMGLDIGPGSRLERGQSDFVHLPGALFVALSGPNHDGNRFAATAAPPESYVRL